MKTDEEISEESARDIVGAIDCTITTMLWYLALEVYLRDATVMKVLMICGGLSMVTALLTGIARLCLRAVVRWLHREVQPLFVVCFSWLRCVMTPNDPSSATASQKLPIATATEPSRSLKRMVRNPE